MQQLIWPLVVAFAISLALGPIMLPLLRRLKLGQNVRDDGPQAHLLKSGTPTMGGILILIGLSVSAFLFARDNLEWTAFCVVITLGFALIGFLDDYIKIVKKRSLGLTPMQKIIGQVGLAFIVAMFAYLRTEIGSMLYVPFTGEYIDMGILFIPFTMFVVVGTVNSVNLTDGLDGLASGVSVIVLGGFALICYFMAQEAQQLGLQFYAVCLRNGSVFCSAAAGGCMAFLSFNSFPAKVFMGDTGSLGLGGCISVIAVLTGMQLIVPIICGMFMVSTVTAIIQTTSYKLRRKRVFKMAPLHHHFELVGMHETKVVVMYMMLSLGLCIVALIAAP